MDKIKTETFEKYAKDNGWMKISDNATPKGRQLTFMTTQGHFIIASYSLDGQLVDQVSPPPPVILMQGGMPQMRSGLDFRGSAQHPPGFP
jgi:hypothetical protein